MIQLIKRKARLSVIVLFMTAVLGWAEGIINAGQLPQEHEFGLTRLDDLSGKTAAAKAAVPAGMRVEEPGTTSKTLIDNIAPRQEEEIPLYRAMAVDLIVPGGGALYYKNYYWGAAFGALKIAGAWAVYHYYRVWEYRRSLYFSARDANTSLDPYHELKFKVPGEGYKTVGELRRDYDRAAQNITFSVLANVLVYTVSLFTTYHFVNRINERSIPSFELSVDRNNDNKLTEYELRCTFSYRI